MVFYRTVQVDGLSIFYREAGRPDAPTLLLLQPGGRHISRALEGYRDRPNARPDTLKPH